MKRVLMIAYFFPPESSSGSYRTLRFVRQLARRGWSPSVISADPYTYKRYDSKLLEGIPPETKVIRVRERDPWQTIQAWRRERIDERLTTARALNEERELAAYRRPFRSCLRRAVRIAEACYYRPDLARSWIGPAIKADRKSTRLNSSHSQISYAVFCL